MQVTVEKLSPVLVEFQVKVPVDDVKQSMDRAYESLAKNAQVKGFRKGKVPRQVLAHLFGDRISADVANKLVEDTLSSALREHKIQPLTNPVVEKPKVSLTDDFTYRARFEINPAIEKVDYEGLDVKRPTYPVDEARIEAEIEKLRLQHATLETPAEPRAAKTGDVATIDFSLDVDGKPVEGMAGTDVTAELGSASLLPAISEALIGKEIGAQCEAPLEIPANFQRADLRGRPGMFHLTLKAIKERILPKLDDEFAKDVGNFETLEALRTNVKEQLEKASTERSSNELAEALVIALCQRNPIPVPPSLVEQQARIQEQELLETARRQGQNVRQVPPEMHQRILADAELKVRGGLLMAEIARTQRFQVTEEDINNAYKELAEQTGKNINKVKVQYQDPKQREILIGMILEDKVFNFIEASAKITDEVQAAPTAG